jgi:CBS domain-containing protein
MEAKDIMTTEVVTVSPSTPVRDIAGKMTDHRISGVPVVDAEGHVVGIVSEGDLMRRPESGTQRRASWWLSLLAGPEEKAREYVKTHGVRAEDVMSRDVITVSEDALLEDIAAILEKNAIKRVPVLREGALVGIVSRANLLHGLVARARPEGALRGDRELRAAVLEAIRRSGASSHFVNVVVTGGAVQLWGAVESPAEKEAIGTAAEATPGVKAVENNLGLLSKIVGAAFWA